MSSPAAFTCAASLWCAAVASIAYGQYELTTAVVVIVLSSLAAKAVLNDRKNRDPKNRKDERPLPEQIFTFITYDMNGLLMFSGTAVFLAFANFVTNYFVIFFWFAAVKEVVTIQGEGEGRTGGGAGVGEDITADGLLDSVKAGVQYDNFLADIFRIPLTNTGLCVGGLYNFLWFLSLWSHWAAATTDPGFIGKGEFEVAENHDPRFCKVCQQDKPDRAHHCKVCCRCIFRMDHHCPWVNNCVGWNNQRLFVQFLFYITSLSVYTLLLLAYVLYAYSMLPRDIPWSNFAVLCGVLLCAESFFFLFFVADFLSEQIEGIETNSTLVETYQAKRGRQFPTRFDKWAEVFGKRWYLWWVPYSNPNPVDLFEPVYTEVDRQGGSDPDEIGVQGTDESESGSEEEDEEETVSDQLSDSNDDQKDGAARGAGRGTKERKNGSKNGSKDSTGNKKINNGGTSTSGPGSAPNSSSQPSSGSTVPKQDHIKGNKNNAGTGSAGGRTNSSTASSTATATTAQTKPTATSGGSSTSGARPPKSKTGSPVAANGVQPAPANKTTTGVETSRKVSFDQDAKDSDGSGSSPGDGDSETDEEEVQVDSKKNDNNASFDPNGLEKLLQKASFVQKPNEYEKVHEKTKKLLANKTLRNKYGSNYKTPEQQQAPPATAGASGGGATSTMNENGDYVWSNATKGTGKATASEADAARKRKKEKDEKLGPKARREQSKEALKEKLRQKLEAKKQGIA
ncbi:unnamed protein product [Amoebophrya sp. A120]|nr:unnamed protein product [Amoebophrya sp. A120]|eukprot:GSA120T00009761001.1